MKESDRLRLLAEKLRKMLIDGQVPKPGRDYDPRDLENLSLVLRRDIADAQRMEKHQADSAKLEKLYGDQRKRDFYGQIIAILNDIERLRKLSLGTVKNYHKFLVELKSLIQAPQDDYLQFRPKPKALSQAIERLEIVIGLLIRGKQLPKFLEFIDEPLAERFAGSVTMPAEDELTEDSGDEDDLEEVFRRTVEYIYKQARTDILKSYNLEIGRLKRLIDKGLSVKFARRRLDSPSLRKMIEERYDNYIAAKSRRVLGSRKNKLYSLLFVDEYFHPFLDSLLEYKQ